VAIPVPLSEADGYHIHPDKIAEEIARGTSVILTSNPRNPTGRVVANPELAEIQDICRNRATLIMDEFYGGYNFTSDCDGATISAASNVEDVDEDGIAPIILIPLSLTLNHRMTNPHTHQPQTFSSSTASRNASASQAGASHG
jgi:DNA-binding transcriptional MocR family regulator